jgi:hypothetical protein
LGHAVPALLGTTCCCSCCCCCDDDDDGDMPRGGVAERRCPCSQCSLIMCAISGKPWRSAKYSTAITSCIDAVSRERRRHRVGVTRGFLCAHHCYVWCVPRDRAAGPTRNSPLLRPCAPPSFGTCDQHGINYVVPGLHGRTQTPLQQSSGKWSASHVSRVYICTHAKQHTDHRYSLSFVFQKDRMVQRCPPHLQVRHILAQSHFTSPVAGRHYACSPVTHEIVGFVDIRSGRHELLDGLFVHRVHSIYHRCGVHSTRSRCLCSRTLQRRKPATRWRTDASEAKCVPNNCRPSLLGGFGVLGSSPSNSHCTIKQVHS